MKKNTSFQVFSPVLKTGILLILFVLNIPVLYPAQDNGSTSTPTRRFALVIGANDGGPGRMKLRYAVSDAKAFAGLLASMGGVSEEDCILLREPDRQAFFSEMKALQKRIRDGRAESGRVESIVYYSGHSDEKNLLLGKQKISYREFRDAVKEIDAEVHIAILDSCASGAFTQLKGGKKKTPFLIDNAYNMKGYAFMTSSSSNETSQESDRLRGSFFTHYLISGMRGAADMNRDGKVTLSEAYQYAFNETLAQTEKTMSGPQHPNYNIRMSGTGDVVMTEIRRSSSVLSLSGPLSGRIFIRTRQDDLIAELNKSPGPAIEIGLEEGTYRLVNIREDQVYEAKIALHKGGNFKLAVDKFQKTDRIFTRPRGSMAAPRQDGNARKRKKRFQVEFYGGFAGMAPADLNMIATSDQQKESFYYDDYYDYLVGKNDLLAREKTIPGEFKTIKNALLVGFRFKYRLNPAVSLSLGFKYIAKNRVSRVTGQFTLQDPFRVYQVKSVYSPYSLFAKGLAPVVGLHIGKKITRSVGFEGFISAGPLFARCGFEREQHREDLAMDGTVLYKSTYLWLEEKGSGIGYALEGGTRLNVDMGKNMMLFIEGGYASQVVKNLSGPGREEAGDKIDTWEGDWAIREMTFPEEWGTLVTYLPTNDWLDDGAVQYRDFKLDLSGFYLRAGISIRF